MIGLGTFYNALGVVFGGLLGLLIGQRLSEDFHESLLKVTGVAVFVLGIAGTLEKMLVVHGSHVESHGSMMLILSLVIGTVIGELLKIEEGFERLFALAPDNLLAATGVVALDMTANPSIYREDS